MTWDLKTNASKCIVMSTENGNIFINGDTVKSVSFFVFLESSVPSTTDNFNRGDALKCSAFGRLKDNIWSRMDTKLNVRLCNAMILPMSIFYSKILSVFKNNCLRCLASKTRLDKWRIKNIRTGIVITADQRLII